MSDRTRMDDDFDLLRVIPATLPRALKHNHYQEFSHMEYAGFSDTADGYHVFRCKGRSRSGRPCSVATIQVCDKRMFHKSCELCDTEKGVA